VRPADANETALAWKFALATTDRPTCLALSRQNLPVIDPAGIPPDAIERGAYVLREAGNAPTAPELILIGTGSEVAICIQAAELLETGGIATRVVSAPCLERFGEQDAAYRDTVLPPEVRARVSVEAGSTVGWHRWVTGDGAVIGMESFGASAPQPVLYEHFGFTPEHVAARGREVARGGVAQGA
jgi:transketolase